MPSGTSLSILRDMVRAEIGASPNPALGTNQVHQMNLILARTQQRLWSDYDWPFLIVTRDIPLVSMQRYYSIPSDLDVNRINKTEVKYANIWRPLDYGVGQREFNFLDSDRNLSQDPALKWKIHENPTQFEVWPIPATNDNTLRFTGVRKLAPLIADTDLCELDDNMLSLYTAAELLAHNKSADAQEKLGLANNIYNRLKGLSNKVHISTFGGGPPGVIPTYRMIGGRMKNN